MATLNQLSTRIANMINQPDNHELKERIKDMFKTTIAKYIRQSTEKNGIDDILTLTFIASVDKLDYEDLRPSEYNIPYKKTIIGTVHKIPVPIRIHNDSPFLYVGTVTGEPYKYLNSIAELKFQNSLYPTGQLVCYHIENGHIIIHKANSMAEVEDRRTISNIMIKAIWENPDEVLSMFKDVDGQDMELPFPADMIESALLEILKVEFNIRPDNIAIKLVDDKSQYNVNA